MKTIHVAVGIIKRNGMIYLTKRADDVDQGGKWEFPGGKVEPEETLPQALVRELYEELGIQVNIETVNAHIFDRVEHCYPQQRVKLDFVLVTDFVGEPRGCEGQYGRWFTIDELVQLEFPEANKPVVKQLLVRF